MSGVEMQEEDPRLGDAAMPKDNHGVVLESCEAEVVWDGGFGNG
jgi:hypothetical protein